MARETYKQMNPIFKMFGGGGGEGGKKKKVCFDFGGTHRKFSTNNIYFSKVSIIKNQIITTIFV